MTIFVDIYDVLTGADAVIIARNVPLSDALDAAHDPEEYARVTIALATTGGAWIGGGAAPLVHLARVPVRYVVRDTATKGVDFLLWGDDDPQAALDSLYSAMADGLEVELVIMPAAQMDDHTARLIDGVL